MKTLLIAVAIALTSSQVFAQTPDSTSTRSAPPQGTAAVDASLATPTGHEVNVSVGGYTYTEPGAQSISIHGVKIGGEYTGTLLLDKRHHWFAQADVRGTAGNVTYTGWCSPFLITPNSASPNGYELDVGDASPCSETGDRDGYLEARVLVGKDLIGRTWAWSPDVGWVSVICRTAPRRRRIPHRCVSLSTCPPDGAHQGCVARRAQCQPGIRPPAPRLAKDPRLGIGRW